MRIRITIGGDDWTDRCIISETQIETGSDGAVSSATLRVEVEGADAAYYDSAFYDTASYDGVELPTLALVPVIIEEADVSPPNVIFRGEVVRGKKETLRTGFAMWRLECAGFERVLDETSLTNTWANKSDQVIIQEAFAAEAPEIAVTSATIDEIQTNLYLDATDFTLRDVLEAMQSVSGARICLTPDRVLYYSLDSSATIPAAPFDIDVEFPDETTTLSPIGSLTPDTIDFTKIANHVTVIGGYKDGGTRATAAAQDATSQTEYGVRKRVLVENGLLTNDLCQARAEAELLQWANPQRYGQFVVRQDGLRAGQKIHITARHLNVDSDFVIRRLSMSWESDSETVYRADYGFYDPRLDLLLAKIARGENRQKKGTILALPPADSVATLHIKALAVTTAKIGDLAVTTAKLDNLAATSAKIGNLAVTTAKIADLAVTNAKIDTLAVSKLTADEAVFTGKTTFGYGANKVILDSGSVRVEASATHFMSATSSSMSLVQGSRQMRMNASDGLVVTDGTRSMQIGATLIRISDGTRKIDIGGTGSEIVLDSGATFTTVINAAKFEVGDGTRFIRITAAQQLIEGGQIIINGTAGTESVKIQLSGVDKIRVNSGGDVSFHSDVQFIPSVSIEHGDGSISRVWQSSTSGFNCFVDFNLVNSGTAYKVMGTQVLGARGAAVADATGAGDVVAQLNALLARCRTHGLIAT